MRDIFIDTNIYSSAFKGDPDVVDALRKSDQIGISAVSIGELLSGFNAGNREAENRAELAEFLDSPRVHLYALNENTAEYYSEILNQLKQQGTPIPTNDIWIAASARQHGLALFTLDKHFENIPGMLLHRY